MSPEKLQDAIGNIDDRYIDEAESEAYLPLRVWLPAASLAACILIMVALIPWRTIFSNNDPSVTDPNNSNNVIGFLDNDTTSHDTTKEPPVIIPDESTQADTEDTTIGNIHPDTVPPHFETETQAPDSMSHDTEDSKKEETTDIPEKEETTAPTMPSFPTIPDPGITPMPQRPSILARSTYPVQEQYPQNGALLSAWRSAKTERINYYQSGIGNIDGFISLSLSNFFSESENKNLIYSPVSTYMSLGMLAEAAAGNSRSQLLDLLGESDIYSLRASANNLWNSCYRDDGIVTSVLGNSIWLDGSFVPKSSTADIIAKNYFASSYTGNMGEDEYNELMRQWICEQTKGALENSFENESLDPDSMMFVMSTLYFKAEWDVAFDPEVTRNRTFHSPDGDVTAQFMYRDFIGLRYVGENFETTCLDLKEGGKMWLILPDEGVSTSGLFNDREAMGFITGKTQKTLNAKDHSAYMWLFLPKFDITSRVDMRDNMERLGVTDVFNTKKADFSSLTSSKIIVSDLVQSARISIDESGCEAASASTGTIPDASSSQTFGFTLDRPFIFVVTSDSGLPLFVGTVNRPN